MFPSTKVWCARSHELRTVLLGASSGLALALVSQAAQAQCAFNNTPGGVDNAGAINCISYNNGASNTGDIINESTGSIHATTPYPPLFAGTSSGISVVTNGTTLVGNITNNGSIIAPQYGINVGAGSHGSPPTIVGFSATVTGSIINNGVITGNASDITVRESYVGGSVINNGNLTGPGVGIDIDGITGLGPNGVTIAGSVISNGNITPSAHAAGINVSHASVGGDVVNKGLVSSSGFQALSVVNGGNVTGSIINTGTLIDTNGSTNLGIFVQGASVGGSVVNSGNITAGFGIGLSANAAFPHGIIAGNISNSGLIVAKSLSGILVENYTVGGSVINTGNITAAGNGIVVVNTKALFAKAPVGGVINTGNITATGLGAFSSNGVAVFGGNITGGVANTGCISAPKGAGILIDNANAFSSLTQASTITGNVSNSGPITAKTGILVQGGSTVTGAVVNSGAIKGNIGVLVTADSTLRGGIVQTAGSINGNAAGIVYSAGAGNASVTASGGTITSGNGTAIALTSAVGNNIITLSGSTVVSGIGNATNPVISVQNTLANTTSTITIGAGSTVEAISGSPGGLAILDGNTTSHFGSVTVNDSGTLIGDVNFGALSGNGTVGNTSTVAVNVLAGGLWKTSGTDVFGAGNGTTTDTLSNAGTIQTTGVTTFQFGNATGGTNTISNGGTLQVGADGNPATLTIAGVATLTNSGAIDLSNGAAGAIQLNGPQTAFVSNGGTLKTTADLAGPHAPANTLNVASTSGTGGIVVLDGGGVASHVTVADPIVLVTTTGATANQATFTLAPGSTGFATFGPNAPGLVKGAWLYTLQNLPNETVLVSSPGPLAFEGPELGTAAQTIWYAASPWEDRQADLRDSSLLAPGSLGGFTPGVWIKAVGDWAQRSNSVDPPAGFTFNLGYHQDTYEIDAGIDAAGHFGSGVGLLGVAVGWVQSNLDFRSRFLDNARFNGWSASVYATYLQGPLFIDGQIKGDFLRLSVTPMMGSVDVNSWGGQLEAGYRIPLGASTLEPIGTLAYVSTQIGNANVLGTTFAFGNEQSFRGALGLRWSAPLAQTDAYLVKLEVDGRVWDEFDGHNRVTLISGGAPIAVQDDFSGVFGEVGAGLNVYSHDGHSSGFLNASYKFKSNYDEGKVAIGYRYQWGA
ncbi:MAG TPA: hypothetical protein VKU90_00575, partial [Caulobacteraceae bacterium]|nr:hypothetical protein [Caulobacteraceae bacterium]